MKSIVSNQDEKKMMGKSMSSRKNSIKRQGNKDFVVISKDRFDDAYNSYDWLIDENKNNHMSRNADDEYRQLARYDDIVGLIEEDKSHLTNFDNFEKNNKIFYGSIRNQIFAETNRILGSGKNLYTQESGEEYEPIQKRYTTQIPDVDKIISMAASEDRSYLDLIYNNNSRMEYEDIIKGRNSGRKGFNKPEKVYNDDYIQESDQVAVNSTPRQPSNEKLDSIQQYEEEVFTVSPNDFEDDVVQVMMPHEKTVKKPVQKSIIEEEIVEPVAPPIQQEKPKKPEFTPTKPTAANPEPKSTQPFPPPQTSISSSENKQDKLANDESKNTSKKDKDEPQHFVQPNKEYPTAIKFKTYEKEKTVLDNVRDKPKKSIEDLEYAKLKNMINEYENEMSDSLTSAAVEKLDVSDSLKVNLYKSFYLSSDELSKAKREQDKKLDDILKEHEDTIRDHKLYEAQEQVDDFYKKTKAYGETFDYERSNKALEMANAKSSRLLNENEELKKKIKSLESRMKDNIDAEKKLDQEEKKLTDSIKEKEREIEEAKNNSLKNKFKPIPTTKLGSGIPSKPIERDSSLNTHKIPKINVLDEIEQKKANSVGDMDRFSSIYHNDTNPLNVNDEIVFKPIIETVDNKHNYYSKDQEDNNPPVNPRPAGVDVRKNPILNKSESLVANTLQGINNMHPNSVRGLHEAKQNKPFSYRETSFNNDPETPFNKTSITQPIVTNNQPQVTPLNSAVNSKKQQLFQSFNPDEPYNDNNQQENNLPASTKILSNHFDGDSNRVVSLREALSKKRNPY